MDSSPQTPPDTTASIITRRREQIVGVLVGIVQDLNIGPDDLPWLSGVEMIADETINAITLEEEEIGLNADDDTLEVRLRQRILIVRVPTALFEMLPEDGSDHLGTVQVIQDMIATSIAQYRRHTLNYQAALVDRMVSSLGRTTWAKIQLYNEAAGDNDPEVPDFCMICHSNWEDESEIVELPCHFTHLLHAECAHELFMGDPKCPLCRQAVPPPS